MMQRQVHFPTILDQPYFCFPWSIGRYSDMSDHIVTREAETMNNFNIHVVAGGRGYVETEGTRYELRRGAAFLYFPMSAQRYYSSEDEPWDVMWVHFYGGEPLTAHLLQRRMHRSLVWTLRQPSEWEEAHELLLDESERYKMLRPTRLSALTYAVVAEFTAQAEPLTQSSPSGTGAYERIVRLLPVMQSKACAPFLLEEWAEAAGVSTYYFCKLFRKAAQMTPMEFMTRCRLQTAKQWLLERTEDAVGAIARDAGYPSVSYFNKKFLENEGMTPSQYRKLFQRGS